VAHRFRLFIGLVILIGTPFIGWPGIEHRAAQMNFAQCGIVLLISTFLPFSVGLFLLYSLVSLFIASGINDVSLKMFQMLFLGTLFFHFVRENAKKDIDAWLNIIVAFFLVNIAWVILQSFGWQIYFKLGPEHRGGSMLGLPGIMGHRVFQGILCAVATPILIKKSFWFSPLILLGLYHSKSSVSVIGSLISFLFLFPKKSILISPLIFASLLFIKKDLSLSSWIIIFERTFPMITDHWLGMGIGGFHNAMVIVKDAQTWWREAHNEFYQLYFEFGTIGISIFCLFIFGIAKGFFVNRKDKTINVLIASFIAFLICCSGQPVMHVVRVAIPGIIITALIFARFDQLGDIRGKLK